jgi:hypothetical protein
MTVIDFKAIAERLRERRKPPPTDPAEEDRRARLRARRLIDVWSNLKGKS